MQEDADVVELEEVEEEVRILDEGSLGGGLGRSQRLVVERVMHVRGVDLNTRTGEMAMTKSLPVMCLMMMFNWARSSRRLVCLARSPALVRREHEDSVPADVFVGEQESEDPAHAED